MLEGGEARKGVPGGAARKRVLEGGAARKRVLGVVQQARGCRRVVQQEVAPGDNAAGSGQK